VRQLFVISAPSGAGKTSLVRALLDARPNLAVSVSHTTRSPRAQEQAGHDYHFVTPGQFQELVGQGAFLEHASVFDNFYGTGRGQIDEKLKAGKDVLLEIDWQGARQVRQALPDCRSIFILPPSREALRQRLTGRGTDSPAVIERRLADAVTDMGHYGEFDYVVVNDQFPGAVDQLVQIVSGTGESLVPRRPELSAVVANLLDSPIP
jgi:guanylate kinase